MADAAPQASKTVAGDSSSSHIVVVEDVQNRIATLPRNEETSELEEDPNPRSPKRRRVSQASDNAEIDFEAAAARALAISLGAEQASLSPAPVDSQNQQNGHDRGVSQQLPEKAATPDQQTRIENLPTLDSLATQILSTLAKMSHLEIGEMLFGPPSQRGQDYRALKAEFEKTKRVYLINSPFIAPAALSVKDTDHINVLRKTNMATFMASIFSGEIGLRIMDINFLDVFVPEGGRLLKAQASIYLELKTQAFIAAKRTAPAMLNQVMLDLFPSDTEKYLLVKRPGGKSLAPSEVDFLKRLVSRRDILYSDMRNSRLDGLELRYRWDDFSREVNSYLAKNYDQFVSGSKDKGELASPNPLRAQLQQEQMEGQFSVTSNQAQSSSSMLPNGVSDSDLEFDIDDFMAQAARAAEIALQGGSHDGYAPVSVVNSSTTESPSTVPTSTVTSLPPPPSTFKTSAPPSSMTTTQTNYNDSQENTKTSKTEFQQYKPVLTDTSSTTNTATIEEDVGSVPHKSQTAPTQVLYERARLVTTNKILPSSRKPNAPSHRRPWTKEEEYALMTGLDQVKGPHWSQILAMYGPGGTFNEALKDRNQVQLKDKARNLKLFFLKAGIEVPYYLQAVTGDLKTRAPGQAEKREAKERERVNVEEGDDVLARTDDLQTDPADESDSAAQSISDPEDNRETNFSAYQEAYEAQRENGGNIETSEEDVLDMEAMIARAAASATQSLGDTWS